MERDLKEYQPMNKEDLENLVRILETVQGKILSIESKLETLRQDFEELKRNYWSERLDYS